MPRYELDSEESVQENTPDDENVEHTHRHYGGDFVVTSLDRQEDDPSSNEDGEVECYVGSCGYVYEYGEEDEDGDDEEGEVECEECGETFDTKAALSGHMSTHS